MIETLDIEIKEKFQLINSILMEVGADSLFDNKHIEVENLFDNFYLLRFSKNENSTSFAIFINPSEIQIEINDISEAYVFSEKNFINDREIMRQIIKQVFSSYILVERRGGNFVKLYFFSKGGSCEKTMKQVSGFYFFRKRTLHLYYPFFA